jgi:hypothetical protein
VLGYNTIIKRMWQPVQVQAGVVNRDGRAKYWGIHALRHFYASWCINRRMDGGLELPLKVVQARLGHASIQMTADVYGHLGLTPLQPPLQPWPICSIPNYGQHPSNQRVSGQSLPAFGLDSRAATTDRISASIVIPGPKINSLA